MQYTKVPISIADQISKLSGRGLKISNVTFAEEKLKHISYYRLRAYTYPFQDNTNPDHPFIFPVTFEEIINFYEFDRDLRLFTFNAIERIEIALRSLIVYHYAMTYGSHWFENKTLYRNWGYFTNDISNLDKEIDRSDEEFIKHYKNKYSSPLRPPAWMSLEVATLTTLSKLFQNLTRCPEKKIIARNLGIDYLILENWMHVLSNVRNICAHHSRIYNRTLSQSLTIPSYTYGNKWIKNTAIDNSKMYAVLCVAVYLLDRIIPANNSRNLIYDLFSKYPGINPKRLNFPDDWKTEPFWLI